MQITNVSQFQSTTFLKKTNNKKLKESMYEENI